MLYACLTSQNECGIIYSITVCVQFILWIAIDFIFQQLLLSPVWPAGCSIAPKRILCPCVQQESITDV